MHRSALRSVSPWVALLLVMALLAAACTREREPVPEPATAEPAAPAATVKPAAPPKAEPPATPRPAAAPAPAAPAVLGSVASRASSPTPAPAAGAGRPEIVLPRRTAPSIPSGVTLAAEQVLRFPIQSKRSTIAPWRTGSYIESAWNQDVFMPLFRFSPDGELLQGVAVGYDVNVDATVFTIHIDPDAVFHDGSPVTASDVKAAWEWGGFPENQASWGGSLPILAQVQGFDAVSDGEAEQAHGLKAIDQRTLEISLKAPDPTWPLKLAVWMLGIFKADQPRTDPDWERHPVGVGPFKVKFDPDSGDIDLTAAAFWWRDRPSLERIELRVVADLPAQLAMYENGEADVIFSDAARQPSVHDPNYIYRDDLVPIPDFSVWYLAFKTESPPFDDAGVRAAFAHAVDMDAIVPAVFGAAAKRATGLVNSLLPCADRPYTGYEYDPEKARRLLAGSKYGSAEDLPPILIELSRPEFIRAAEWMREQWRENLGVQVTVNHIEEGQQRSENANLLRLSAGSQIPDAGQVLYMLGHSASANVQSTTGHYNSALDALIDEGNALGLDAPHRCSLYLEAQQRIIDNYYYIPIIFGSGRSYLVQPWVLGLQTAVNDAWQSLPYIKIAQRTR